jgi:hypothetical protein
MKRLLLLLLLLSPRVCAQVYGRAHCTVIVAGEFERGAKMIGNGVFVCHGDRCCLVTAIQLLRLNGRLTGSVTVIIPVNPALTGEEIESRMANEKTWRYLPGGITTTVSALNIAFLNSQFDAVGLQVPYPAHLRDSGVILTRPVQYEDLADDSDMAPGNHVETFGMVFDLQSRRFSPVMDTGSVVALSGNNIRYTGRGVKGLGGSPVWLLRGGVIKLAGIHSYHEEEYESYAVKSSVIKSRLK